MISKTHAKYLKGKAIGNLGFCMSSAVDLHPHGRQWLEVVEMSLNLGKISEQLEGLRIVHATDLHYGRTVSSNYLRRCIHRINQLEADIVVLTGDYITYDTLGRFRQKLIHLVAGIKSSHGVYACLGNHDYGVGAVSGSWRHDTFEHISEGMKASGVNLLRNESMVLEIDRRRLWLVGLGDIWADDFDPVKAFAGICPSDTVIALAHNPETIEHLDDFAVDAVMSGHTHGCRIEWKVSRGRPLVSRRSYYSGLYQVGGKKLYVNRGLGRVGKAFFSTRPEIAVFNLGRIGTVV